MVETGSQDVDEQALMLEQNEEWAVTRRYMTLKIAVL
jgi:hypothetical protein